MITQQLRIFKNSVLDVQRNFSDDNNYDEEDDLPLIHRFLSSVQPAVEALTVLTCGNKDKGKEENL